MVMWGSAQGPACEGDLSTYHPWWSLLRTPKASCQRRPRASSLLPARSRKEGWHRRGRPRAWGACCPGKSPNR